MFRSSSFLCAVLIAASAAQAGEAPKPVSPRKAKAKADEAAEVAKAEAAVKSAVAKEGLTVAIVPIKGLGGVKQDVANVVTEQLAAAIQQRGFTVMSPDDLATRLGFERQKELLGCTDASCLVEVGSALGVERLVSGTIAFVGQSVVINLALINNQSGTVEYRYSERVKQATDEAFLDLVPKAVAALFPQDGPPAVVEKKADGSGARVAAWVTGGLGAAAIIGGVIAFNIVTADANALHDPNTSPDKYQSLHDHGTTWLYGGIAAFAAGGALAITSAILFFTSANSAPSTAVTFVPTSSGGFLSLGGSF